MYPFDNKGLPDVVSKVLMSHEPAMIGGSYVVNPETANDIDIVVHEFKQNIDVLYRLGFHALQQGDDKYDEIDHMRLINVFERAATDIDKKVNVIVVGAAFWPAYIAAIREMTDFPTEYTDRSRRIALHRSCCKTIAQMAKIELPDSAY